MSGGEVDPITVKLTAEDYAAFNRYHGRKQLVGLFIFYWCVVVIAAQFGGGLKDPRNLAMLIPVGLLASVVMLGLHLWSMQTKVRKIFNNDKVSQFEQHLALMESGIRHTTGETTRNLSWDEIAKAAETRSAILIYLSKNKVVLLPKRDIGDLQQVKDMLKRHLPSGKLKLKG